MNKTEFWLMNNPLRGLSLRLEARKLRKMSPAKQLNRVLEIGCDEGVGAEQILRKWQPKQLDAIDLDPKMIARAKKRSHDERATFRVADVTDLSFAADQSYDAIFDFAILHHVPNWQQALSELHRVLKLNGLLHIEDGSIEAFTKNRFGRFWRRLLDHPYQQMYSRPDFEAELTRLGFKQISTDEIKSVGLFWLVLQRQG